MPSPLMLTGTAVKSFSLGQHWLTLNIEHWLISTNQDLRGRIAFEVLARIGVQLTASCWESNGRALFGPLWNSCCHIIWIKLLLECSIYHETDACMSVCATSQSGLNVFCVCLCSEAQRDWMDCICVRDILCLSHVCILMTCGISEAQ